MLSRGQGQTLGTYVLLIEALDAEGREEEMEELWQRCVQERLASMPRAVFLKLMQLHSR